MSLVEANVGIEASDATTQISKASATFKPTALVFRTAPTPPYPPSIWAVSPSAGTVTEFSTVPVPVPVLTLTLGADSNPCGVAVTEDGRVYVAYKKGNDGCFMEATDPTKPRPAVFSNSGKSPAVIAAYGKIWLADLTSPGHATVLCVNFDGSHVFNPIDIPSTEAPFAMVAGAHGDAYVLFRNAQTLHYISQGKDQGRVTVNNGAVAMIYASDDNAYIAHNNPPGYTEITIHEGNQPVATFYPVTGINPLCITATRSGSDVVLWMMGTTPANTIGLIMVINGKETLHALSHTFVSPTAMTADSAGNLWVADSNGPDPSVAGGVVPVVTH